MNAKATTAILFFCFIIVIVVLTIHTQDQGIVYTDQPVDKEITCEINQVAFQCEYNGSDQRPYWHINDAGPFSSNGLPNNHFFNGTHLIIQNVTPELNNTRYQCMVKLVSGNKFVPYHSSVGTLIIKKCQAPHVQCTPIYYNYFMNLDQSLPTLKAIFTNITQKHNEINSNISYVIKYFETSSGKICHSSTVQASCNDGRCQSSDIFELNGVCSNSTHLNVTVNVTATNIEASKYFSNADPIKIVNNVVKVVPGLELQASDSEFGPDLKLLFKCTLLNKTADPEAFFSVYTTPKENCGNLSLSPPVEASIPKDSQTVVIEIQTFSSQNLPEITCLTVHLVSAASNVIVEGEYDLSKLKDTSTRIMTSEPTSFAKLPNMLSSVLMFCMSCLCMYIIIIYQQ